MLLTYTANNTSVGNLWQVIQDYTQNQEATFVSEIPNFVELAEERIYNSVQLPALRKSVTGGLTGGNQYLTLPADYLSTMALSIIDSSGNQSFLIDKDVEFIREAYPGVAATATPKYFGQFDYQTFIVGPTPDQSYNVELHYNYYPPSIVTVGNSWVGENFAEVLLYGALREAYVFMKGEADVIQMYEGNYQEALALLKQLSDGKLRRTTFRDGQVRVPVK